MATVNLSPLFNGVTNFDSLGNILTGGQLFTYQAGSSTPLATYTTVNGTIANANPIVLGSDGKIPNELWLLYGYAYKFVLQTASSVLVNTYDNISGIITTIPTSSPTLPTGVILIWSGSVGSIPSGYVLCNGSNGTPDLRNSFVLGAGNSYTVGQTGGSADAIVVSHTHTATVTDPAHGHGLSVYEGSGIGGLQPFAAGLIGSSVNGTSTTTGTNFTGITVNNTSTGTSGTSANLPPYYALAYIMKS
jgi:hypothetical protein